jgi:hypothetical protein
MDAKTSLLDDDELFKQLSILGEAIKQAYLSLKAYRDGSYKDPQFKLPSDKKAYVSVTTLEQWYIFGDQLEILHEIVREKITQAGLDESILAESPYVVIPVNDMEKVAFLAKTLSFEEIFQPYLDDDEMKRWEFGNYLTNQFKQTLGEYEYVFNDEIDSLFTVQVDGSRRESRRRKDDLPLN